MINEIVTNKNNESDLEILNLIFKNNSSFEEYKNIQEGMYEKFLLLPEEVIKSSFEYNIGSLIAKSKNNPILFLYAFIFKNAKSAIYNESNKKIDEYILIIENNNIPCKALNHKSYKYGKILTNRKINAFRKLKLIIKESKNK